MIVFKEKSFFWGAALMAGSTALSLGQGSKQMKESQKQADQMEKSNLAIAQQLNKIAKTNDPEKINQATTLLQNNYSLVTAAKTVGGFTKDLGRVALKNKKALTGTAVFGGAMAGGGYIADKIIQRDINKQEENNLVERSYSIPIAIRTSIKKVPKVLKNHGGSIATGAGLGAGLPLLTYGTSKLAKKDMIADMEEPSQQKTYSVASFARLAAKKVANSAKFTYRHPTESIKRTGKAILGGTSSLMGGGGYKGVKKVGQQLQVAGKMSGNKLTTSLGNAIINNPNAAVAASIPVGSTLIGAAYTVGDKAVRGTLETFDKNAFKYEKSQEQVIND